LADGVQSIACPRRGQLGDTSLMFLIHSTLTGPEIKTCTGVRQVLQSARRLRYPWKP
jgi:hypothetical protein